MFQPEVFMKRTFKVAVLLVASVLLVACAKKVKQETTPADNGTGGSSESRPSDIGTGIAEAGAFSPADLKTNSCLRQRVIYFDYDQDLLKPEYQAVIACHSKYLRDRPGAQLRLEGHADERGTREYNMALGERRGNGVSAAFNANSADMARIEVISSGEERPLCLDSDESCWSQNRRVDISYSVE
jgi:peptidoglycan-associated lipoprotein